MTFTPRAITIEASDDAEHPDLQIRHCDETTSHYRWNAEGRRYLRRHADEAWRPITPADFIIEKLEVNDHDRLVRVALTASRTVRGTQRTVRLELTTAVQTLG